MVVLNHVPLDEPILVQVVVNVRVNKGVVAHGQRAGFDEERKHRQSGHLGLQLLAEGYEFSSVHLV